MNNKEMSMLILESMESFHNLIKVINFKRYSMGKVLTERQFFALVSIRKHGKIELKNLSRELHVSTSSLCILLNKLVEQDYVYREEDSRDRRNTFYGITTLGNEILNKEMEKFISIVNDKIEDMDDTNKNMFYGSLSNVKQTIENIL